MDACSFVGQHHQETEFERSSEALNCLGKCIGKGREGNQGQNILSALESILNYFVGQCVTFTKKGGVL